MLAAFLSQHGRVFRILRECRCLIDAGGCHRRCDLSWNRASKALQASIEASIFRFDIRFLLSMSKARGQTLVESEFTATGRPCLAWCNSLRSRRWWFHRLKVDVHAFRFHGIPFFFLWLLVGQCPLGDVHAIPFDQFAYYARQLARRRNQSLIAPIHYDVNRNDFIRAETKGRNDESSGRNMETPKTGAVFIAIFLAMISRQLDSFVQVTRLSRVAKKCNRHI